MDLQASQNQEMFKTALNKCANGLKRGWLNPTEAGFVRDMIEEWTHNGAMFEPSVKQFNWLRQIAIDLEKL